jgi:hypothetical protein
MAHELLEDVLRTSDAGGRTRRRNLMPLSIALHGGAIAALLLVPLVSDNDWIPGPARIASAYVSGVPEPPVPPNPPPPKGPTTGAPSVTAPTVAPDRLEPETRMPVASVSDPSGVPAHRRGSISVASAPRTRSPCRPRRHVNRFGLAV